jgi:hypothetical protein
MRSMDNHHEAPQQPGAIRIGFVVLRIDEDGTLTAEHKSMKEPVRLDAKQLERWALRQLREQVA